MLSCLPALAMASGEGFSAEMAISAPLAHSVRTLSFAVTSALRQPSFFESSKMVGFRTNSHDSISTDFPVFGSRQKFDVIPCASGKLPVTSDALLTLVTDGSTLWPTLKAPSLERRFRLGVS